MLKYTFILLIICIGSSISDAQNYTSSDPDYISNVKLGEAALNQESFDSCMVYYRKAFKIKQTSVLSTLRMAACAYSGNYGHEYEKQMNKAISLSWTNAKGIFNRNDEFKYLKGTPFEANLKTKCDVEAERLGINIPLMEELEAISVTDQEQRKHMRKFKWGSPQMDSLWVLQNYSDSVNLIRIEEIIEKYGYPGKSLVGSAQAGTAFMVIQHSNQDAQEKYLPLLKEEADKGEIRWSSVALMIDRVLLGKGEKQIYGSQVRTTEDGEYYIMKVKDPENLDKKRAEVGLGPINDYCNNWDFEFDLTRHKEIWAEVAKKEAEEADKEKK